MALFLGLSRIQTWSSPTPSDLLSHLDEVVAVGSNPTATTSSAVNTAKTSSPHQVIAVGSKIHGHDLPCVLNLKNLHGLSNHLTSHLVEVVALGSKIHGHDLPSLLN